MKNKKLYSLLLVFVFIISTIVIPNVHLMAAHNIQFEKDEASKVNYSLSPDGLTVTIPSKSIGKSSLIANKIVNGGKWYWEVTADKVSNFPEIGVSSSTGTRANYNNTTVYTNDGCIIGLKQISYINGLTNYGSKDVIGVALDKDNNRISFYKNGAFVKTVDMYNNDNLPLAPSIGCWDSNGGQQFTVNFGGSEFKHTPPVGFTPYANDAALNNEIKMILELEEKLLLSVDTHLSENININWTSSNTTVATVDSNGMVTAAAQGETTIIAAAKNGNYKEVMNIIVVDSADDYRLAADLKVGESCRASVDKNQYKSGITWSAMDESVATVSSKGKITAQGAGLTLVTARNEEDKEVGQVYIRVR